MARCAALVVCGLGALVGACSPYGGGAFECSVDTQCGTAGTCSSGYCSFPDSSCATGLRYGELSGPLSNQCVAQGDGGMRDDAPVAADASSCYGEGLVRACFTEPPTGSRTLDATLDTGTSTLCDPDPRNAAWCVVAAETITVQSTVTAIGLRPLVLVATQTIHVQGTLDVASHRATGTVGAGANPTACGAGTAPGTSGGGAGGSFGGNGGNGGGGRAVASSAGVAADAMASPIALRGGCRGQPGNGANAGSPGDGGGAVYLIAESSITVDGSINASGAGATPGTANGSGGGGGGSGGYIGLDAPACTNNGIIFANGGGGAEGSGSSTTGNPGSDPIAGSAGAAGDGGSINGGDGGAGAAGATLTGSSGNIATSTGGGGGGGGGAGIVNVDRTCTIGGVVVSPPAT